MIRFIFSFLTFTFAAVFTQVKSQDDRQEIQNIGLPVVNIYTANSEEPTCDYVTHPEGAMGESIANASKVPARMCMTLFADTLYDSGEYEKDNSGLTIKIRGNTSAYKPKKPYKLKLQKKTDLLMRGDEEKYKDKDWLLLPISIYTITGLKVNELVGMPYTPQYRFVNVCINGDYRGVYMLMEQIERNKRCRIDVDKESGYIVELDPYWWNEDVCFTTLQHNGSSYRYTFKYPDSDDVNDQQIAYIQNVINTMEASIVEGTYTDVIDVETFAKWLLGHDILGTWDSGGSNRYFAKYDETVSSKIFIPCMWDFDSMARMNDDWARIHKEDSYYKALFQSDNTAFTDAYISLWDELSDVLFNQINQYFTNIVTTDEWQAVEASLLFDQQRWDYEDCTLAEDAESIKKWLNNRQQWLNQAIADVETGIYEKRTTIMEDNSVYTLEGIRVSEYKDDGSYSLSLPKGMYIINRRKIFVR